MRFITASMSVAILHSITPSRASGLPASVVATGGARQDGDSSEFRVVVEDAAPIAGSVPSQPGVQAQAQADAVEDGEAVEPPAEPRLDFPLIDKLLGKKQYMGSALVYLPVRNARPQAALGLMRASSVKKHKCEDNTWTPLSLTSSADQVTAGSVKYELAKDGGNEVHESVHFMHVGLDIDYLYAPRDDYTAILTHLGFKDAAKAKIDEVVRFAPSEMDKLPEQITIQFVNSKVQFAIKRAAFTKCETVAHGGANHTDCLLLMRPTPQNAWLVGKPLLDHIISVVSVGLSKPFISLCYPNNPVENAPVTFTLAEKTIGMPWTPNDYMYLVVIGIIALAGGLYVFGKLLKCCRGRRGRASASGETDTEPLISRDP